MAPPLVTPLSTSIWFRLLDRIDASMLLDRCLRRIQSRFGWFGRFPSPNEGLIQCDYAGNDPIGGDISDTFHI
eukprot:SAG31_NODE_1239_length_9169_cov_18.922492_13_plen_73_part_00